MSVRFPTLLGAAFGVGFASAAGAGDLGYPASALGEFAAKPRTSFENAPSLAAPPLAIPLSSDQTASPAPASEPTLGASASPAAPAPVAQAEPETAAPSPQEQTPASPASTPRSSAGLDEYEARCFVKIDGQVLIAKTCRILRDKDKEVIFEIDDGPLTIKLRQGRVWTARLKDRDFGNVYKTGSCWGAHGFYVCDRGRV